MKRLLVAFAAMSLAACGPIGAQVASSSSAIERVQLQGLTGLTTAANAYTALAQSVQVLVEADAFSREQLLTIQRLNARARILIAGTNTALTYEQRINELRHVITGMTSMIGGK